MATTSEITNIQRMLNSVGESLVVDGIMGAKTISAIKNFQLKNEMLPTGIIDSDLIDSLNSQMTNSSSSQESFFTKYRREIIISTSLGILIYGIVFINSLKKRT